MFTKPAVLLRVEAAFALGVSILLYSESHARRCIRTSTPAGEE
jgi:hypothetical protein